MARKKTTRKAARRKNGGRIITSVSRTGGGPARYVVVVDGKAHIFNTRAEQDNFAAAARDRILGPKRKRNGKKKTAKRKPAAKRKQAKRKPTAKRKNPANNRGIVHLVRFGRAICGARGHIGVSSVEQFRKEAKPCARCLKKLDKKKNPCGAKRKRNGSDLESAAQMYKKFHGEAPKGVRTVTQLRVTRDALADCGRLVELVIDTGRGGRLLSFPNSKGVRVATTGDGGQLYFVGGDAALNLGDWPGLNLPKDQLALGELASICYHTSKDFHNFEPSDYEHKFGETGKPRPVFCYDVQSNRFYLVGGGYQVKRAGIVG